MKFRVTVKDPSSNGTTVLVAKVSNGFTEYRVPVKLDLQDLRLVKRSLPVTGGEEQNPSVLALMLLATGVLFVRTGRQLRRESRK